MSERSNIKLGKREVIGIDPEARGLIRVRVRLEPEPDEPWTAIFLRGPAGPMWPMSMHPPSLSGAWVTIRPPDGDEQKYIAALSERVDATNAAYARDVEPELERQKRAAEAKAEEDQRRIDEARKRLGEGSS